MTYDGINALFLITFRNQMKDEIQEYLLEDDQ